MPWPGFEPGCLAALPPQSGGHARASNATVVHHGACSWLAGRGLVIDSLVLCDGRKIPGAKRGPTLLGASSFTFRRPEHQMICEIMRVAGGVTVRRAVSYP
jgi:hypothetical protein